MENKMQVQKIMEPNHYNIRTKPLKV